MKATRASIAASWKVIFVSLRTMSHSRLAIVGYRHRRKDLADMARAFFLSNRFEQSSCSVCLLYVFIIFNVNVWFFWCLIRYILYIDTLVPTNSLYKAWRDKDIRDIRR